MGIGLQSKCNTDSKYLIKLYNGLNGMGPLALFING